MILSLPYLTMAYSSDSTQKLASSVFDSSQGSISRVAQSMIVTKFRKPFFTGM